MFRLDYHGEGSGGPGLIDFVVSGVYSFGSAAETHATITEAFRISELVELFEADG